MTSRFSRAQGGKAGWEGSKLFGTSAVELSGQSVLEAGGYKGQELTEPLLSADTDSEARRSG